jgi:hypothetical protein
MALFTDLLNLDLSGTTEKIIAEYIWYAPPAFSTASSSSSSSSSSDLLLLSVAFWPPERVGSWRPGSGRGGEITGGRDPLDTEFGGLPGGGRVRRRADSFSVFEYFIFAFTIRLSGGGARAAVAQHHLFSFLQLSSWREEEKGVLPCDDLGFSDMLSEGSYESSTTPRACPVWGEDLRSGSLCRLPPPGPGPPPLR